MKLNDEEINVLIATAQINHHTAEQTEAMLRGMAVMIAEYEVMKERLVELEEIYDEVPARWQSNGEPIVDVHEAIRKHQEKMNARNG